MGLLPGFLALTPGRREVEEPWSVVEPPDQMSARLLALVKESAPETLVPPGWVRLFLRLFLAFNLRESRRQHQYMMIMLRDKDVRGEESVGIS